LITKKTVLTYKIYNTFGEEFQLNLQYFSMQFTSYFKEINRELNIKQHNKNENIMLKSVWFINNAK